MWKEHATKSTVVVGSNIIGCAWDDVNTKWSRKPGTTQHNKNDCEYGTINNDEFINCQYFVLPCGTFVFQIVAYILIPNVAVI